MAGNSSPPRRERGRGLVFVHLDPGAAGWAGAAGGAAGGPTRRPGA